MGAHFLGEEEISYSNYPLFEVIVTKGNLTNIHLQN